MQKTAAGTSLKYPNTRLKRHKIKWESPLLGILFVAPCVLLIVILLFIPMLNSLYLSFFNTSLINPAPEFTGLQGYIDIFKSGDALLVLKNSLLWTFIVAFFQFFVGLASAVILNQRFRGRAVVRSVIIIPWIIPGVVAAMVWKLFYDAQFGFLNTVLFRLGIPAHNIDWLGNSKLALASVILAAIWKGFGFSMLMYLAALQSVPQGLYDSARIDGCNSFQQFFFITIPEISGIIKTTLLLTCIWTFNYFEIVWVMTGGGPVNGTQIAPTDIYQLAFKDFNQGDASRIAALSFLLVSVISLIYIRRLNKQEGF